MKATAKLCMAVVLVALTSCFTFEIEGDGLKTDASKHGVVTVHGSLYGFTWSSDVIEACEDNLGIYRVEFHTNGLYFLASVLSLGLYVPQTVEYWCQAPPPDDDEDGELLRAPDNGRSGR